MSLAKAVEEGVHSNTDSPQKQGLVFKTSLQTAAISCTYASNTALAHSTFVFTS